MARALSPSFKGRPARTHVLPVPHVPDGLTIAPIRRSAGRQGTEAIMPDNGMAEAFVRTLKRDYVRVSPVPDTETVMRLLPSWMAHYNEVHPHKALGYRSPREFITARSTP